MEEAFTWVVVRGQLRAWGGGHAGALTGRSWEEDEEGGSDGRDKEISARGIHVRLGADRSAIRGRAHLRWALQGPSPCISDKLQPGGEKFYDDCHGDVEKTYIWFDGRASNNSAALRASETAAACKVVIALAVDA